MMLKLERLIKKIRRRIFTHLTVFLYENINNPWIETDVTIKDVSTSNVMDILSFRDYKYIDLFKKFLKEGDKGYYGYLNNKCVHRSWVKIGPQTVYPHQFLPMKITKNEIFIHYCEKAPSARGRNIYPGVLTKIVQDFPQKKVFLAIYKGNYSSIRGVEKAGFALAKTFHLLVLCGIRFIRQE